MAHLLAPSILSANFLTLQEEIKLLNTSKADWIHVDVMDGHFVPNLTFGFPIIKQIKSIAQKPLDVHVMISNPQLYIKDYADAGADYLSVHAEACIHLHRVLQSIHHHGMKAGVAINPHTSLQVIEYVLPLIDVVCIMSVNPGFGGQSFIESTYEKVSRLKQMIMKQNTATLIEIDGGVSLANAKDLIDAGADVLVAGSAVFGAENPVTMIDQLKAV